jgi:hypothetical protein
MFFAQVTPFSVVEVVVCIAIAAFLVFQVVKAAKTSNA